MSSDNSQKKPKKSSSDGAGKITGEITGSGEIIGDHIDGVAIPAPLIEHVFSLLPVKSIIRFRSFLKHFENPNFILTHLKRTTAKSEKSCLVVSYPVSDSNLDEFKVVGLNTFELDYPTSNFSESCLLIGSCNGIVAIYVDATSPGTSSYISLWNPATRDLSKEIVTSRSSSLAIVFDEVTSDIKVVGMDKQDAYIYSVKDDNWNTIKRSYEFKGEEFMCLTTVKGCSYWVAGDSVDDWLLKFDVNDKKFARFPIMDSPWSSYACLNTYVNYNDSLGFMVLSIANKPNCFVNLYALDEENSLWTMKISVGPLSECFSEVFEFSGDDQVVARSSGDNRLCTLSPKTGEITYLPINFPQQVANFKESLFDLGHAKSALNSAWSHLVSWLRSRVMKKTLAFS